MEASPAAPEQKARTRGLEKEHSIETRAQETGDDGEERRANDCGVAEHRCRALMAPKARDSSGDQPRARSQPPLRPASARRACPPPPAEMATDHAAKGSLSWFGQTVGRRASRIAGTGEGPSDGFAGARVPRSRAERLRFPQRCLSSPREVVSAIECNTVPLRTYLAKVEPHFEPEVANPPPSPPQQRPGRPLDPLTLQAPWLVSLCRW